MNTQCEVIETARENLHIPIYIAGLVIGLLGMFAYVSANGFDLFAVLMFLLLFMGFGVSWLVADGKMQRWVKDVIVGFILIASAMAVTSFDSTQSMLMNPEGVQANDPRVTGYLAWFIVVYCFNLTSPKTIVFLCVPVLSLIGLSSTLVASPEMIMYFVLFIGFACFILMQERALSGLSEDCTPAALSTQASNRMSRRIAVAASIAGLALVIGGGVGSIFYNLVNAKFHAGGNTFGLSELMHQFSSQEFAQVASGPVADNPSEVMTIAAPDGHLWRGQTYGQYNGRGWRAPSLSINSRVREIEGTPTPSSDGYSGDTYRSEIPASGYLGRRKATHEVAQVVRPTSGRFDIVFAASEPKSITCNRPLGLVKTESNIVTRYRYSPGMAFTIVSDVSNATPDQLRAASTNYPDAVRRRYLQTPKSCVEVEPLARRITKDEKTVYDKAVAISNYLTQTYTYDAGTPATPKGEDPVPYFLFDSKKGYCDVFASSMVIMCRQVGIPARWATGFATGEYNPDDKRFHLRVKDYHAWVEVYFPEYGWIEFDPTPAGADSSLKDRLSAALTRLKLHVQAGWPTYIMVVVLIVLAVYLLKTELLDRYRRLRRRHGGPQSQAAETYMKMCRLLARSGFPRDRAVTPSEYASDLEKKFHIGLSHVSGYVKIITADFEEARYANRDLPEDRIAEGTAVLSRLQTDLREARKKRLFPSEAGGISQ